MSETTPPPLPPANAHADVQNPLGVPVFSRPSLSFNERFPFPTWLEVLLMPLSLILLQFVVAIPIAIVSFVAVAVSDGSLQQDESVFFLGSVFAVIPILVWGWWRSRRTFFEAIGLRRVSPATLLAVIPFAVGFHILSSELANIQYTFLELPNLFEDAFDHLFASPFMGLFVLSVVAPFTEEPIFRGLILGGMLRRRRVMTSLFVSAFLFSLIHINPAQMPIAFLLGLTVGWLFIRSGSLWPCILAHALHNGFGHVVTFVAKMEIQGYNSEPASGVFHPLWFDLLGILLTGAGVFLFCVATPKSGTFGASSALDHGTETDRVAEPEPVESALERDA